MPPTATTRRVKLLKRLSVLPRSCTLPMIDGDLYETKQGEHWRISPQSVIQVEGPLLLLDQFVLGRDVLAKRVFPEVAAQVLQC